MPRVTKRERVQFFESTLRLDQKLAGMTMVEKKRYQFKLSISDSANGS